MKPTCYPFSKEWFDAQTEVIKYALMYVDDKPNVTCSDNGYDKAVAVEASFPNSLPDEFRKGDSE